MKLPNNQPHHLSNDNAAYAGSGIYSAYHPLSLDEVSITSTQTFKAGKDQEVTQQPDWPI